MFGVAHVFRAVGKGDFEAFGEDVDAVRRAESEISYAESRHQIEDLKHVYAAGAGRRRDREFVSTVCSSYRAAPHGAIGGQIFHGEDAASFLDVTDDSLSKRAVIKYIGSSIGDIPQGRGEIGLNKPVARRKRPSSG